MAVTAAWPARANPDWFGFPVIYWQAATPDQLATLKRLGVTAGAVIADRVGDGNGEVSSVTDLRDAGLGCYLENAATDFYAPYHRYTPNKPVNWLFEAAQAAYRAHPEDPTALYRQPSLSDAGWQERIAARLTTFVARRRADRPLFYDLGDETGIADLSAYWDFDTSPESLIAMRIWLRGQYGSLGALNQEWGTRYLSWDAVQPELTAAAMRRTDGNYAAWSDFKAWMDEAFARALRRGTDAVHAADPHALAGIEGAQMPGWGGYDYTRLAHAVDVMEIYDSGENLPIVRSLNPRLITLRTVFGGAPADLHAVWRTVLRGVRGLVIWDDAGELVSPDGTPGPYAAAYTPLFTMLHGAFGEAMAQATPVTDPVAILYSPESFRVQWMLDHRAQGDAWTRRNAEIENEDNRFRVALHNYAEALGRLRLQPRFIAPAELEAGRLDAKALILPDTLALSDAAARAIAAFQARGGKVIADRQPGVFDGHGKRLVRPSVAGFHRIAPADITALGHAIGLTPWFRVAADAAVASYVYRLGNATLLALQTVTPGEASVRAGLLLAKAAKLRNVVSRQTTTSRRLELTLDPIAPTLLEVIP